MMSNYMVSYPLVIFLMLFFYIAFLIVLLFFLEKRMSKRKPIKVFSDFDVQDMGDIMFTMPIILKLFSILLVIIFLVPGLVFMRNFILLLDPKRHLTDLPPWEQTHIGMVADIFLIGSIVCLILFFLSLIKLIDDFKSKIRIQNNELIVIKLREIYCIDLGEIREVLEYRSGTSLYGPNAIRWITVELKNEKKVKIKTAKFEPREMLRLIAFLDNKAKIRNTSLTLDDFVKFKWY